MKKLLKRVLQLAAVVGVGYAVKKLADNEEAVKREIEKAKEDPKGYAKNVQDSASDKVDELAEKAKGTVDKVKNEAVDFQNKASKDLNELKDNAKDVKNQVADKVEDVKSQVNEKVEDVKVKAEDVKDKAQDKAEEVKSKAEDKVDEAKDKAEDVKEDVESKKKEVKEKVEDKKDEVYTTPDSTAEKSTKGSKAVLADEGGLAANEVKKEQQKAKNEKSVKNTEKQFDKYDKKQGNKKDYEVVGEEGKFDSNHNVHIVKEDK